MSVNACLFNYNDKNKEAPKPRWPEALARFFTQAYI